MLEEMTRCIPPNPRRVGNIIAIHGPQDGPLYMGSHIHQHPPQSELPVQRCSTLDNKKANTPPQSEQPAQRCSRLDNEKVHTGQIPPPPAQPQLATGYVEAGAKLRESRRGKTLGEDVSKLGGGRDMENPNIADCDPVAHEVQVDLHMLHPLMLTLSQ